VRGVHPRALLDRFGYRPKKRLGQNFLIDERAAARIAELVIGDTHLARVVEIGPGTGRLTQALVERHADVTAIEIDRDMVALLHASSELKPAHIVHADALAFDYEAFASGKPWRMTGNLPYNIATPLIMRLIGIPDGPQTLVVMVQKEVADRFSARPSTAAYGSLSVAVQYKMLVERAFTLKPNAFYPRPKVDSAVVRLVRRTEPLVHVIDENTFLQVVRGAFAYRRKTLANSLSLALGVKRAVIAEALQYVGLDTEIRGEQLDIADFARLADRLST
jgi:16S rRNA (adenine1518-N6/adenine1519-N6)-dimethyltransferase